MQEILLSIKFAWKSLTDNPGRTLLTLSGIIIGTIAVFSVLSLGDALRAFVAGQIESFGSDIVQTEVKIPETDKNSTANAIGLAQGIQVTTLTLKDGEAIGRLPNIEAWYGGSIGQELATYRETTKRIMIFGAGADAMRVDKGLRLAEGDFYSADDDSSAARVVVLGANVKETFFGASSAVGEMIKLKGQSYRVVGTIEKRGSTGFVSFDDFVYIPIETLQKKVLGVDYVSMIQAKMRDGSRAAATAADIETLLRDRHDIDDPKDDDFAVTTIEEAKKTVDTVFSALQILLLALASISLVVSGVGIMNVMFVAVAERTTEIGLRKAVGARDKDILRQFLFEAVAVAISGGVIGILIALLLVGLAFWGVHAAGLSVPFAFGTGNVFSSLAFALVSGLLFGVYPAWKASRVTPISAIRSDA